MDQTSAATERLPDTPPELIVSRATRWRQRLAQAVYTPPGYLLAALLHQRIPYHGCLIDIRHPAIPPAVAVRLLLGRYEKQEITLIRRWLPADCDVLELGSSIGVTTAHIARRLGAGQRLVCVEANPYLLGAISANARLNSAGCALTVLNAAVDYSGPSEVRLRLADTNTNSRVSGGAGTVAVPATKLARLLSTYALRDVTVVCDIEGAEVAMLQHDQAALRQVRRLIVELHTVAYAGALWTPERLRAAWVAEGGFVLRATNGNVCVFEHPA